MRVACPWCAAALTCEPAIGKIATCPHCGRQFQVPLPIAKPLEETPQVIEQTAKQWKIWQMTGVFLTVGGASGMYLAAIYERGSLLLAVFAFFAFLGLGAYSFGRAMAWWHHG